MRSEFLWPGGGGDSVPWTVKYGIWEELGIYVQSSGS